MRKRALSRTVARPSVLKTIVASLIGSIAIGSSPAFASGPTSPGTSWIVMNAANGKVLAQHRPYQLRYPASLTKLMTLDLAFDRIVHGHLSMRTELPVTRQAADVSPVKLNLRPGQKITVKNAMLGMTTMSANDAATALGLYLGHGSMRRFSREATEKAHALGMLKTRFMNSSGLPNNRQVTDAYDIALLTRHILRTYPRFRYLFAVHGYHFRGRWIPNINGMLTRYRGTIGMKTGFTDRARFNVVTAAKRDGHLLVGVLFHARSWDAAYHEMAIHLDHGFAKLAHAPHTVIASRRRHRTAKVRLVADHIDRRVRKGWIAQVGTYDNRAGAARQARIIHHMRGIGAPRVAPADVHGRRVWRAELAGLDRAGARYTCTMMARYHKSCMVLTSKHDQAADRRTRHHAAPHRVAEATGHAFGTGWAAQVGAFGTYARAKHQALRVRRLRGIGVALVAESVRHGHKLWRAQLAGLDHAAARQTCVIMKRHHQSCFTLHPAHEQLAMR